MTSGDSTWLAAQETGTAESADSATPAASAAAAANGTSAAKDDDRKPSFTPATAASAPAASAPAASASAASAAAPTAATTSASAAPTSPPTETDLSYRRSSYSGTGSSYSSTAYASPSSYSRSDWSTGADSARPASAPAGGAGTASPVGNGYPPGRGPSPSAASAVGGATAGLASSVTSAWQKRGSAKGIQTRKSTKRQAMLTLARVEPWSVMKFSFVASVVAFIILFVAVAVLYMVLSALGVFDSLQNTVSSITSSQSDAGTNISHWFSASLILGYTAMLGALNIVLITAMSTVGSVIYNLIAKTIGGIEVTLRETD